MKKLSEYTGEEAMSVMTRIMASVTPFVKDSEIMDIWKNKTVMEGFAAIESKYPKEYCQFLAAYANMDVKDFDAVTSMQVIATILRDPLMLSFFVLPGQKTEKESSGSATESSEEQA